MSTEPLDSRPFFGRTPRRFAVRSLGCKVSRADACLVASRLGEESWELTRGEADVVVLQTCSVTDRADRDARREIRRLRRERPAALLVVTGCLAQRDPDGLARMPEVDLVVGHAFSERLAELVARRELGLLPGKVVWGPPGESGSVGGLRAEAVDPERTRAFLKVQDGCERRCSFCIVPTLRGAERSADPAAVAAEVNRLGEEGIPEVVLTGVHLAAFGGRSGGALAALVSRLDAAPPRCRVRVSSLEPMEAGGALVEAIARSRCVVPHLHLPLQSGSASVLRRMRRGIAPARYRELALRAVGANPRLHLATDLIAGFPGETDAEFEETLRLVDEVPFASLHVFPFSPRSGTLAERLHRERPVPAAVVHARARALRELDAEKRRRFAERARSSLADVVALRGGRGLTDHYLDVALGGPRPLPAPASRYTARLLPSGVPGELRAEPVGPGGGAGAGPAPC